MAKLRMRTLHRPIMRYFRTRRMQAFWQVLNLNPETRVLDVGGSLFNWQLLLQQPQLVLINISMQRINKKAAARWLIADGMKMPFKPDTFDIAYSNSVIEHLGTWENQQAFAVECQRVGQRYYVQTPNKWFPIEPHLLTPFIHWLPRSWQRRLLRNFTVWGWLVRPTPQQCDELMAEIRLLTKAELQRLFPDAEIWHERIFGMTKSLIAVKK